MVSDADAGQGSEDSSITSRVLLWIAWGRIAVKHEAAARSARQRATKLVQKSEYCGDELNEEFEAALVVITACANALEAIYGGLLARAPSLVPQDSYKPDWKKILLALEGCFDLDNQKLQSWCGSFEHLFKIKRNAVVHFKEPSRALKLHPVGVQTSPEHCEYTLKECELSIELLLEVLTTCGNSQVRTSDISDYREEFRHNSTMLTDLRHRLGGP